MRKQLKRIIMIWISMFLLTGCNQLRENYSNSGPFGNGDATLLEVHREDFSAGIDESIRNQFENKDELKKVYFLSTNDWFLAENMTDFSQIVTTEVAYVVPGGEDGTDNDTACSFYDVNEDGTIEWDSSSYTSADTSVPSGFSGLTYEMIDTALEGILYEDYIITYAQRLGTVFVWVRSEAEDVIITYPTRPDFLSLEVGKIYTLEEIKSILTEVYNRQ